jgi:succinate dehydrogenase / fumarate reductase membrane anchor subunit
MMQNPTSLSSSGLRDWLIQRVTAIILAVYVIFLLIFVAAHSHLHYDQWQALFANPFMRIFSFLALLSLVTHSWVGIWTVLTDYIKCAWGRLFLEVLMILALICYLVWGVGILWRV